MHRDHGIHDGLPEKGQYGKGILHDRLQHLEGAKNDLPNLNILFWDDPILINTYHGLCQPPAATTGQPSAAKFIAFVASEKGQDIVRACVKPFKRPHFLFRIGY